MYSRTFLAKSRRLFLLGLVLGSIFVFTGFQIPLRAQVASPTLVYVTAKDKIPNFAAHPTIYSVSSGSWSSVSTWSVGRLPDINDVVQISSGHTITYDVVSDVGLAAVGVDGILSFRTNASTQLKVGTLIVSPIGKLEVGTKANPVDEDVQAEIIIANRPLSTATVDPNTGIIDPQQYGTSLIVLGTVTIFGAEKTPTWVRTSVEPIKGATTLDLVQAVSGWKVGDKIVLPDTRHLSIDTENHFADYAFISQTELLTVSAISPDGKRVTISSPLVYDHKGPRNPDGTMVTALTGEIVLPHVGNMARNIVIRSESPSGTRGHTLYTHGASVSIQNAGFYDLGRTTIALLDSTHFDASGNVIHVGTNQIGRYAVHMHHLWGKTRQMPQNLSDSAIRSWLDANGWQYEFSGNAIGALDTTVRQFKWGITIHGSHFGRVNNNVLYNIAGSGLQTEDSSESYNLISHNFASRINGLGQKPVNKPTTDSDITGDLGKDGSGFWYRGPHNWMEGNVAADTTFSSHYLNRYYLKDISVPLFPGANPTVVGEGKTMLLLPMLSFDKQEGYGATQSGLYGAWVAGCCVAANWPELKITDLTIWHAYSQNVFWYHNGHTTFDHFLLRGDPQVTSKPDFAGREMKTRGFALDFYENLDLKIQNGDIAGMVYGIDVPKRTYELGSESPAYFANLKLQNYANIRVVRPHPTAQTSFLFDTISFATFNRPPLAQTPLPLNIDMAYYFGATTKDAGLVTDVKATDVVNYNGVSGDTFKVYFLEGGSPCTTMRVGIRGYVCGGGVVPTPPALPSVPQPISPTPSPLPTVLPLPLTPVVPPVSILPIPSPAPATPPPIVVPPIPPSPISNSSFALGAYVKTLDFLRVRSLPSLQGLEIGKQRIDRGGTIIGGPITADGFTWWNIDYHQGVDGWSAEDWLSLIPAPRLHVGMLVRTTDKLFVRTAPNLSASKIGAQLPDSVGTILEGPAYAGGLWWWKVDYSSGADGWSTESWLTQQ